MLLRVLLATGVLMAAMAPAAPSAAHHSPHRLPADYEVQSIGPPAPATGLRFADGLVNVGDVDGDGEDDLAVGLDKRGRFSGAVWVYSGGDGSLIHEIPPPDPDAHDPGAGDNGDGFGTSVGRIFDVGSCAAFAGPPGQDCPNTPEEIATRDGVDDLLVTAVGVDVATPGFTTDGSDQGMAYVIDGTSGAVLYRIVMPEADRIEQLTNDPDARQGAAFGRSVISPAGNAPCAGFMGFGTCRHALAGSTAMGDVDGAGTPDIVVGASDFTETTTTSPDCRDPADPPAIVRCSEAGRVYVYRGEDLEGHAPATPMDAPLYTIRNPDAQWDDPDVASKFHSESFGYALSPVGDLGKCNVETIGPGESCMSDRTPSTSPAYSGPTLPDFIPTAPRADDFGGVRDVGLAFAVDGPTGRIVDEYPHPQPEATANFGGANYAQPAIGDVGASVAPDVYQPAPLQTVLMKAQGRGYVMSGDFTSGGAEHSNISVFDDPTPSKIGNFGTSSMGLGDVARDSRGEVMVGAYGPDAPAVFDAVINDVTIFDPVSDEALQRITDPAQQEDSGFGRAMAPLGDLNEDTFMDFAIGSGKYDGATVDQGRLYILRSDDTQPECPGHAGDPRPDIIGTAGDDDLTGTAGAEIICALDGDDEVDGLGGDDLIELSDGDDRAVGGSGDDVLNGAVGDDTLIGGSGGDTLNGGSGNDDLRGQGGADTLKGGPGPDELDGGSGVDSCNGGTGVDSVSNCP
jgi:RTX calcium-binding nonapeptide repeat (4 copies)